MEYKEGMKVQIKLGDTVTIKSQEWYDNNVILTEGRVRGSKSREYTYSFIKEMCNLCGKTFTISEVHEPQKGLYYYKLKDSDNQPVKYNWHKWMFEDKTIDFSVETSDLKIGDYARVKSLDWYKNHRHLDSDGDIVTTACPGIFWHEMSDFCGKLYKIEAINGNEYRLQNTNKELLWYSWMFEEVIPKDKIDIKKLTWLPIKSINTIVYNFSIGDFMRTKDGRESIVIGSGSLIRDDNTYVIFDIENYEIKEISATADDILIESGKYLKYINLNNTTKGIANQLYILFEKAAKLASEIENAESYNKIEVGDVVACVEDFGKAIVIFSGIVCQVYTIDTKEVINVRKDLLKVVNKGPYVAYIDVSKTTTEKIATLHELLDKKSNSSAYNSNEFDLTKVIYKSKRMY